MVTEKVRCVPSPRTARTRWRPDGTAVRNSGVSPRRRPSTARRWSTPGRRRSMTWPRSRSTPRSSRRARALAVAAGRYGGAEERRVAEAAPVEIDRGVGIGVDRQRPRRTDGGLASARARRDDRGVDLGRGPGIDRRRRGVDLGRGHGVDQRRPAVDRRRPGVDHDGHDRRGVHAHRDGARRAPATTLDDRDHRDGDHRQRGDHRRGPAPRPRCAWRPGR